MGSKGRWIGSRFVVLSAEHSWVAASWRQGCMSDVATRRYVRSRSGCSAALGAALVAQSCLLGPLGRSHLRPHRATSFVLPCVPAKQVERPAAHITYTSHCLMPLCHVDFSGCRDMTAFARPLVCMIEFQRRLGVECCSPVASLGCPGGIAAIWGRIAVGFRQPYCLAPWCSWRRGLNRRVFVVRWCPKLGGTYLGAVRPQS